LDEEIILNSVKKTGKIVSCEEHNKFGGLGESISRLLTEKYPVRQEFVAVNDSFGESGTPAELMKKYGLDASAIVEKAKKLTA
jgi:transketolase